MLFVKSCKFNIDTNMVDMETVDNIKLSVDCDRVEDEYGITVRHRANLDYLLYNHTIDYVNLLLNGHMKDYLDEAADFKLD